MNKFLFTIGGILLWVVACFFITGCASVGETAAYRETAKGIKEKKAEIYKNYKEGKVDIKTTLALIKDLDDLKDKMKEKSGGDLRRFLIEVGIILSGVFGLNRYRDKIPGATRKDYVHKING